MVLTAMNRFEFTLNYGDLNIMEKVLQTKNPKDIKALAWGTFLYGLL